MFQNVCPLGNLCLGASCRECVGVSCPTCTFKTVEGVRECEMCGTTLAVASAHWERAEQAAQQTRRPRRLAAASSSSEVEPSPADAMPAKEWLSLLEGHFLPQNWTRMSMQLSMLNHEWHVAVDAWVRGATALWMQSPRLSDDALIRVARRCTRLLAIDLSARGCTRLLAIGGRLLSDDAIRTLTERQPYMTRLELGGCEGLTQQSVLTIARNCPLLARLGLSRCIHDVYSDAAMAAIGACRHLETLDLRSPEASYQASRTGLRSVVCGAACLKELRVTMSPFDLATPADVLPVLPWANIMLRPLFGVRLIASQQPELEHFEFDGAKLNGTSEPALSELLNWPRLRSLTIMNLFRADRSLLTSPVRANIQRLVDEAQAARPHLEVSLGFAQPP